MTKFIKIFLPFWLLGLVLFSCQSEDKKPKGLLSEETMTAVLVDVHILEAQIEQQDLPKDSQALFIKSGYQYLYQEHDITEGEFMSTYQYYENHPAEMDELYQKVVEELTRREAKLKGEEVQPEEGESEKP